MSPRAAWRLESFGFTQVYDYVAGEMDWFANGLPIEGKLASLPRAGAFASRDVPTCQLNDLIGDVKARVGASGWESCVVVNERRVVLGILRNKALGADPRATAEAVMQPGPSTFRPNVALKELLDYMREHDLSGALITTSDGKLLGYLRRDEAEQQLRESDLARRREPAVAKG